MSDLVGELYRARNYPPMSHPVADPAMIAVSASMAGRRPPHPATARILEIGCGSGHHLIPLAQRWPGAEFTGIDIAPDAIAMARRYASGAGLRNINFLVSDLRSTELAGQEYDYIIAHGFFSWVENETKAALLRFCAEHLSPAGIATISFNVWAGWKHRYPIIETARKIQREEGVDENEALTRLAIAISDPQIRWIIDDMFAKGPDILAFDDFGPVNDALPLDRVVAACAQSGLQWLGESDPSKNGIPPSIAGEALESLRSLAGDPLGLAMAVDELTGATFRAPIFCRQDTPLEKISTSMVFEMSVRAGKRPPAPGDPQLQRLLDSLAGFQPCCAEVGQVLEDIGEFDPPVMARAIFGGITTGVLEARIEPLVYDPLPPLHCKLNAFQLLCASGKMPLVDAWHVPCAFPDRHYELLAMMDGSKTVQELELLSKRLCPDLDFQRWLHHLAARGMFS